MKSTSSRPLAAAGSTPVFAVEVGERETDFVRDILASDVFAMVNGYALAHAIFTFAESPLLEVLEASGSIDAPAAIRKHALDPRHALGLLRFLATQNLFIEEAAEVFFVTPKGRAMFSQGSLGWLRMFRGGYGPLMERASDMLHGKAHYGSDIQRDGYYVARGSSMITNAILDEVPYRAFEERGVRRIADLGCGAGNFLIEWARRDPAHEGIGIDLSPEAVAAASQAAAAAGVAGQIRFVAGDCFDPKVLLREGRGTEAFFSFGMEHELLRDGDEAVIGHIDRMAEAFPGGAYLLGEPMLNMNVNDGKFYWIHILSHQGIPRNVPGWCETLRRLRRARLERVLAPEHQRIGAYFELRF